MDEDKKEEEGRAQHLDKDKDDKDKDYKDEDKDDEDKKEKKATTSTCLNDFIISQVLDLKKGVLPMIS